MFFSERGLVGKEEVLLFHKHLKDAKGGGAPAPNGGVHPAYRSPAAGSQKQTTAFTGCGFWEELEDHFFRHWIFFQFGERGACFFDHQFAGLFHLLGILDHDFWGFAALIRSERLAGLQ